MVVKVIVHVLNRLKLHFFFSLEFMYASMCRESKLNDVEGKLSLSIH